ncbi:hypothetical protein KCP73_14970 [Salmonella enterica subsp. enterica]|nr:hypothetical protein KCP73_14970 [Salmonella enterica subsp. enterica]
MKSSLLRFTAYPCSNERNWLVLSGKPYKRTCWWGGGNIGAAGKASGDYSVKLTERDQQRAAELAFEKLQNTIVLATPRIRNCWRSGAYDQVDLFTRSLTMMQR